MLVPDTADERDEGHCIVGYSVVRPGRVEHVGYCPLRFCWLKCLENCMCINQRGSGKAKANNRTALRTTAFFRGKRQ